MLVKCHCNDNDSVLIIKEVELNVVPCNFQYADNVFKTTAFQLLVWDANTRFLIIPSAAYLFLETDYYERTFEGVSKAMNVDRNRAW